MALQLKTGSFTGTGAALNVSVGFRPELLIVYNHNDAGALFPSIMWFAGMPAGHGFKSLGIVDNGTTGLKATNRITTNGLSTWDGVSAGAELAGTVSVTAGSSTVTGSGTTFNNGEIAVGDVINVAGQTRIVAAIASATSLTVTQPFSTTASGVKAMNVSGRPAGFTIGADADLNFAGEVGYYMAIGN